MKEERKRDKRGEREMKEERERWKRETGLE